MENRNFKTLGLITMLTLSGFVWDTVSAAEDCSIKTIDCLQVDLTEAATQVKSAQADLNKVLDAKAKKRGNQAGIDSRISVAKSTLASANSSFRRTNEMIAARTPEEEKSLIETKKEKSSRALVSAKVELEQAEKSLASFDETHPRLLAADKRQRNMLSQQVSLRKSKVTTYESEVSGYDLDLKQTEVRIAKLKEASEKAKVEVAEAAKAPAVVAPEVAEVKLPSPPVSGSVRPDLKAKVPVADFEEGPETDADHPIPPPALSAKKDAGSPPLPVVTAPKFDKPAIDEKVPSKIVIDKPAIDEVAVPTAALDPESKSVKDVVVSAPAKDEGRVPATVAVTEAPAGDWRSALANFWAKPAGSDVSMSPNGGVGATAVRALPRSSAKVFVENCSPYMPFKNLKEIMDPEETVKVDSNFATEQTPKSVSVTVPRYVENCMELKPELQEFEGKFFVFFKNAKKFESGQSFDSCMQDLMMNKPQTMSAKPSQTFSFDFEKLSTFDPRNPMSIVVASPKDGIAQAGGVAYAKASIAKGPLGCMAYEEVAPGGAFVYGSQDALLVRYQEICDKGSVEEIGLALSKLDPKLFKDDGQFKMVQQLLTGVMQKVMDDKVSKAEEEMSSLAAQMKDAKSQEEAEAISGQYIEQMRIVDRYGMSTDIAELQMKVKQYQKIRGRSKDGEQKLLAEIKKLNERIGRYSKFEKFMPDAMVKNLATLGLKDQADEMIEFKRRSANFAKVYPGAGGVSLEVARQKINREVKNYQTKTREHQLAYNVAHGIEKGVAKGFDYKANKAAQARDKEWSRYTSSIQALQKSCYSGSQASCKTLQNQNVMQKKQNAALAKREKYNTKIAGFLGRSTYFGSLEEEYQMKVDAEREADEMGDFSSTDYSLMDSDFSGEDSFSSPSYYDYSVGGGMGGRDPAGQGMQQMPWGQGQR